MAHRAICWCSTSSAALRPRRRVATGASRSRVCAPARRRRAGLARARGRRRSSRPARTSISSALWVDALGDSRSRPVLRRRRSRAARRSRCCRCIGAADKGVRVLSWFPGAHVGCNAPLVDARAARRDDAGRSGARSGSTMLRSIAGADLVHLQVGAQADGRRRRPLRRARPVDRRRHALSRRVRQASRKPTRRSATNRAASTTASRATSSRRMGTVEFEELDNGPRRAAAARRHVPPARRALPRDGRVRPVRACRRSAPSTIATARAGSGVPRQAARAEAQRRDRRRALQHRRTATGCSA